MGHFIIGIQLLQLRAQRNDKLILAHLHCGGMRFHMQGNEQVVEALAQWSTHVLGLNRVQQLLLVHMQAQRMGSAGKRDQGFIMSQTLKTIYQH